MSRSSRSVRRNRTRGKSIAVALLLATLAAALLALPSTNAAFSDTTDNTLSNVTADTLDPPTALSAIGGGTVTLSWTPTVDSYADGYRVLRAPTAGGPYTQIAETTPQTANSYVDSPPGGTYYYVVRSFSASWESADSNEAAASTNQVVIADTWQAGLTHTLTPGSSRMLIVVASNEQQTNSTPTMTALSYGGQAMVQVLAQSVTSFGVTSGLEIWTLDEAGLDLALDSTLAPTWSGTPDTPLYAHAIFGSVDQVTPIGDSHSGFSTADTPNPVGVQPLTTTNLSMVIAAATAGEAGNYIAQNGFTLGLTQDTTSGGSTALGTAHKAADGSDETVSMLFAPAAPPWINRQIVHGFVLNPAP